MSILKVENVRVAFDREAVVEGIDFSLGRGETLAVVGPNGAGKTVLVRAILGLVPFSGRIVLDPHVRIGYVPQRLAVDRDFPITVGEFLQLRTPDEKKIIAILRDVDPYHATQNLGITTHDPKTLLAQRLGVVSSGQFQKILIAWALLGDPDLLLFDEPTAGIDIGGEEGVYELLHRLQKERGLSLLLVSHDLSVVYRYAKNVLCLNRRSLCFGPPSKVLAPKTLEALYGAGSTLFHHDHT